MAWGCSSVVEHLPFKQVVEGSIPSTLIYLPRTYSDFQMLIIVYYVNIMSQINPS